MTWRFVDGFAVGRSHAESETPCQDRCAAAVVASDDGGETFVCVVSDGAGSANRSERGAEVVCATLLARACDDARASSDLDRIGDERVRAWFLEARAGLLVEARENEVDLRDYAATALLGMASPTQALCAALGDGAIVVRRSADEPFEVALWPEAGEYVNQTYFVTDETAAERIAIKRFDAVSDLVAFSDGLQHLALDRASRTAFAPFFSPLVGTVRASRGNDADLRANLARYLASPALDARTDDDKALVVGCRLDDR